MTTAHGTRSAYWRGCRCDNCRDAHRRYLKAWRADVGLHRDGNRQALTNPRMVDAAPVAEHLDALLASGWTRAEISRDTGLWHSMLGRLHSRASARIRREHAAALLALPPLTRDDAPDPVVVDRLVAGSCAWTDATLAERLEAGRRVIGREGGPKFCETVLHLRHDAIRSLRQEVAA